MTGDDGWDEADDEDEQRAPICACGVTALPAESGSGRFICENPDCDAFGDEV
ncbi:MAG: hypothetical protein H0W25_12655 [Acidimicrobiia bacterium]|nr:hypothetical protein [Acidimicrobiia bacterium]